VGEKEGDRYSTARHKMDWTKESGPDSGWEDIQELAEAIEKNGMWHTPMVMEYKGDLYAIHGWRRIRSAVMKKQPKIKVNLVEGIPLEEAEAISFKENYTHKRPSDDELGDILWRAHLRHPDWPLEKIGEFYGVGGPDPKKRAAVVHSFIRHRLFLERHKEELKELKIPKPLARRDTQEIQAAVRELTGRRVNGVGEREEELEREILKASAETGVPPTPIVQTLRREKKKGVEITPVEAAKLAEETAYETPTGKQYISIELDVDVVEGLKRWKLERDPGTKVFYWGVIVLEYLRETLRDGGWIK